MATVPFLNSVLRDMQADPYLGEGIKQMWERRGEFSSPMAAMVAGVASTPAARIYLNAALDDYWAGNFLPTSAPEIVIGAGLHAAIYCAARVASGHAKPLVVEASPRVGGVMATSRGPSFYLNSRNRPGPLGLPGSGAALNVLPGAPVQPSDLAGEEYQRNDDLALVIRATLAMCATVVTNCEVDAIDTAPESQGGGLDVSVRIAGDARSVRASRAIVATGLGAPITPDSGGARVIPFLDLLRRMDDQFPLRNMRNVAVIGNGDSARTAIECLVGYGPARHGSVASLDYVERISWYARNIEGTRKDFVQSARARYARIGCLLPLSGQPSNRLMVIPEVAGRVGSSFDGAWVNDRPYDHVIWCAGFQRGAILYDGEPRTPEAVVVGGRVVASKPAGVEAYYVGPAAQVEVGPGELAAVSILQRPESQVALWRYASRTSALAAALEPPVRLEIPPAPKRPKPAAVKRRSGTRPSRPGAAKATAAKAAKAAKGAMVAKGYPDVWS